MNISSESKNIEVRLETEPDTRPARERRARILLADDDPAVRDSLALVLETENYEVVHARDGKEAVVQFERSQPDLVLLDLNMPRQNGWSAFEAMELVRPLVPCVVITAKPNQQECAHGHGIDVLMEKPLDIQQLLDIIRTLLEESHHDHVSRVTSRDFRTLCIPPASRTRRR